MGRNKGRVSGGRSSIELCNRLCFRQTYRATSVRQDGKEESMKTKSKLIVLAVWTMTALLAGCQSGNQPTTEQPAEQPSTKQASAKSGPVKHRAAATEARVETVTVPAGTTLAVR